MNVLLKSLHIKRGFFGKSLVLEPGVEQDVPVETANFLKNNCEQFLSHVQSGEIEVRPKGNRQLTLFLKPITNLGKKRPPTPYCAHEIVLKANALADPKDVNSVSEDTYNLLLQDPCFSQLVGSEILVVGSEA